MTKSSIEEKFVLTFLVTNCEIYRLNEDEALEYIYFNLLKPISRRTYYNYKRKIYRICLSLYNECEDDNDDGKDDLQFFKLPKTTDFINCEQLRLLLLDVIEHLIIEGLKMDIHLSDFHQLIFFPKYFNDTHNHVESVLNQSRTFIDNIEKKLATDDINQKSLPSNVTIKKEYIKCGKSSCLSCKHGPYYYGYWRDKNSGKLKKKYIGINK
jgi:hypothetical protein